MSTAPLQGIQVCVFDAYGTLFDVHSAVARHRTRLADKADRVSALWRTKQLEYTWLRSLMHCYADFAQVTAEALDYALAACEVDDPALKAELLAAYDRLDCYPEVPAMLRALKGAGMRTAILSNGSPAMLQSAVDSAGLADLLDAVLSVHRLAMYKPHPDVYRIVVREMQVEPARVSFQSSNGWDAAGAASFGFKVVWVNRFAQPPERLPAGPHRELRDLVALPSLVVGA